MKKKYLLVSCVEDIWGDRDSFDDMGTEIISVDTTNFNSTEELDEYVSDCASGRAVEFGRMWYNGNMERAYEYACYLIAELPDDFDEDEFNSEEWYEYLDENVPDWDENF